MPHRDIWTVLLCCCCTMQLAIQAPVDKDLNREFTYPSLVDVQGKHLSYDITAAAASHRHRRNSQADTRTYFKIDAFGESLILNVSLYTDFIHTDSDTVEYMQANGNSTVHTSMQNACHHVGHVQSVRDLIGGENVAGGDDGQWVSVSSCKGLRGVIATQSGYMFIEPVMSRDVTDGPRQHTVYKKTETGKCITPQDLSTSQDSRESAAAPVGTHQDRLKRSVLASDITIETAVVADKSMLDAYGREDLEAFLFSVMGVVHHLYGDPSVGHSINVVLVRTIILEEYMFSSDDNGHRMLDDFSSWQQSLKEDGGAHFDMAVMVTKKEICEANGINCGTLGMADISSVCSGKRSCNVNKDTGLSTSFTIAHELGHNLGLRHDGDPQARCSSNPRYLMAPTFAESLNPHMWSSCSREQLTKLLSDQEKVSCLLDKPGSVQYQFSGSPILHGMEYTPTEQCRLQAGTNTTEHCPGMKDDCRYLWCQPSDGSSKCAHQHSPPAPGTACTLTSGGEGVCYQGACQEYSHVINPRDGGWGEWGKWSVCSRTCGMGVQYSVRACDSPIPVNGGRWCSGAKRRYSMCHPEDCPPSNETYRDTLCRQDPPNHKYTSWKSASLAMIKYQKLDMCYSHCETATRDYIHSVMHRLGDGAPCRTDQSRGVCVQGHCEAVSCEGVLGVDSYKDECVVWCGRGDSCVGVSGVFNNITQPGMHLYYEAVFIPEGSTNIKVEEVTRSANNYITIDGTQSKIEKFNGVVRREGISNMFFANSAWMYSRAQNTPEYFSAEGPVNEGIFVWVLANSAYDGVRYTFSVPKSKLAELRHPVYRWQTGEWGTCKAECAWGLRTRAVYCVKLSNNTSGGEVIADSFFCDPASKPMAQDRCYTEDCVYDWRVDSWSECNVTCGNGHRFRNIYCEWTKRNGVKEIVNASQCELAIKPLSLTFCHMDCTYEWVASEWSDCDVICGNGGQTRTVYCNQISRDGNKLRVEESYCNRDAKPELVQTCQQPDCVYVWRPTQWSECSSECGVGVQQRSVLCDWDKGELGIESVNEDFCNASVQPVLTQTCYLEDCVYGWSVSDWTECSVSVCGNGLQERIVICEWTKRNGDRVTVSNSSCLSREPLSTQACHVDCVYEWSASQWGSCTGLCGEGVEKRDVDCEWIKTKELKEKVNSVNCASISKPASSRVCELEICRYNWLTKEWAVCDAQCGEGWKRREVVCQWENLLSSEGYNVGEALVEDEMCGQQLKPEDLVICHAPQACPQWHTTDWSKCSVCGTTGIQSRSVQCLDSSGTSVDHASCPSEERPTEGQECTEECPPPPCEDSSPNCHLYHKKFCAYRTIKTLCCVHCSS